jgi:MFS family permease
MNVFIAVLLASALSRLGYQMARSPVLPRFAEDLGAAPELIGVIVAASTITGVFFKLPAGVLSDVLGRKRMMVLGALFFAVPPFFYPLVSDAYALLLLRFVHGFATAIFSPVASAYVAGLAEQGRGARLGLFSSGNDVGATAGPLIGGLLLFYTTSYTAVYLVVATLGVITLLVVILLPEPARADFVPSVGFAARARAFWQGVREIVRSPPVLIASAIEGVMYLGYGAFLGFLPIYAKANGLNDAEIAIVLGAQLAMAMAAKPIAGRGSDRFGRKPVIIVGLVLCVVALPLIFRAGSFESLTLVSMVLGLGVAAVTPVTNALIADLVAARRLGAAMGVFGTVFDFGEAMGPILAGFLIGQFGYTPAFDAIAAATAVAAVALVALVRDPAARPTSTH